LPALKNKRKRLVKECAVEEEASVVHLSVTCEDKQYSHPVHSIDGDVRFVCTESSKIYSIGLACDVHSAHSAVNDFDSIIVRRLLEPPLDAAVEGHENFTRSDAQQYAEDLWKEMCSLSGSSWRVCPGWMQLGRDELLIVLCTDFLKGIKRYGAVITLPFVVLKDSQVFATANCLVGWDQSCTNGRLLVESRKLVTKVLHVLKAASAPSARWGEWKCYE